MADPVVHFEMPADDRKRMRDFYSKVFGWQAKQLGPEMGDFVTVETTESENGTPRKPGTINGGFYQRTGDAAQTTTVTIQVDDIAAYRDKIVEAGGKISGDIMDMPGIGRFMSFFDTEGNRVNLIQPAR
ncbi:MAG: VOC family protein [Candidatus Micrarchaeota archaeon]|nr:VOC family protein [Candidatus Micrarchaeota archaeon]